MRAFLGAVALVVYWLAGTSYAFGEDFWTYGVEPPPASYRNVTPSVPVFRHYVKDPREVCGQIFGGGGTIPFRACTTITAERCDVYLPTVVSDGELAALDAHEVLGHCNNLIHPGTETRGWVKRDGTEVKN